MLGPENLVTLDTVGFFKFWGNKSIEDYPGTLADKCTLDEFFVSLINAHREQFPERSIELPERHTYSTFVRLCEGLNYPLVFYKRAIDAAGGPFAPIPSLNSTWDRMLTFRTFDKNVVELRRVFSAIFAHHIALSDIVISGCLYGAQSPRRLLPQSLISKLHWFVDLEGAVYESLRFTDFKFHYLSETGDCVSIVLDPTTISSLRSDYQTALVPIPTEIIQDDYLRLVEDIADSIPHADHEVRGDYPKEFDSGAGKVLLDIWKERPERARPSHETEQVNSGGRPSHSPFIEAAFIALAQERTIEGEKVSTVVHLVQEKIRELFPNLRKSDGKTIKNWLKKVGVRDTQDRRWNLMKIAELVQN